MTYNRIVIMGYLGRDSEVKPIGPEKDIVLWSVATHDKDHGELKATWHRAVIFDAPDLVRLAKKGSLVLVEGRLSIRPYRDKQDIKRLDVEIIASRALIVSEPSSRPDSGEPAPGATDQAAPPPAGAGF